MTTICECDNGSVCPVHTPADEILCPDCETAHAEDDECPVLSRLVPCEFCGTPTLPEHPYGALCVKCCFAPNH